jgi:hypothetical protein
MGASVSVFDKQVVAHSEVKLGDGTYLRSHLFAISAHGRIFDAVKVCNWAGIYVKTRGCCAGRFYHQILVVEEQLSYIEMVA